MYCSGYTRIDILEIYLPLGLYKLLIVFEPCYEEFHLQSLSSYRILVI